MNTYCMVHNKGTIYFHDSSKTKARKFAVQFCKKNNFKLKQIYQVGEANVKEKDEG